MVSRKIIVVGGALAGPAAAARAREIDESAEITILERGPRINYGLTALHALLGGELSDIEQLNRQKGDYFRDVYRIAVECGTEVETLDPVSKSLTVVREGKKETRGYDSLILCPGAASRLPDGAPKAGNLFVFRTLDDLRGIVTMLEAGARRVAVIGGGPMGFDVLHGLRNRSLEVTVIEREAQLLPGFGARSSSLAAHAVGKRARIRTKTSVENFVVENGKISELVLNDGSSVPVDLVIATLGIVPRTELAEKSGVELLPNRSIPVDPACRTSVPGVYACGVCVSLPPRAGGEPVWYPQAAVADRTAQVAGANAAGADEKLPPPCGSYLIRYDSFFCGRTGETSADAASVRGRDAVRVTEIEVPDRESFLPNAEQIAVSLIWERSTGRILGLEAAGSSRIERELQGAAVAIAGGLDLSTLAGLDFAYLPELSTVRSPLNTVAGVARFERLGSPQGVPAGEVSASTAERIVIDVGSEIPPGGSSIPGATAIPLAALRDSLASLDPAKDTVLVSETGKFAWLAARILSGRGYKRVTYLRGGMRAWRAGEKG